MQKQIIIVLYLKIQGNMTNFIFVKAKIKSQII